MGWLYLIRSDNIKFRVTLARIMGTGSTTVVDSDNRTYSFSYRSGFDGSGVRFNRATPTDVNSFNFTASYLGNQSDDYTDTIRVRYEKGVGTDLLSLCIAGQTSTSFTLPNGTTLTVYHDNQVKTASRVTIGGFDAEWSMTRNWTQNTYRRLYLCTLSNAFSQFNNEGDAPRNVGIYYIVNLPRGIAGSYGGCECACITTTRGCYALSDALTYQDYLTNGGESVVDNDPIGAGGYAGGGGIGGGGTFDDTSDEVGDDELPTESLSDIGFVTLYTPTLTQIKSLAQFMWSNNFFDNVLKLKADLFDCVIGLHILPFKPSTSGTKAIYAGNVQTPVNSLYTNAQFQKIECGSIAINEYWGNYLDYAPYTQIELMLPFIGSRALDTDEVMGRTLSIRYKVDIATGAFVAVVMADGRVMYQYTGACAVPIPITGQDKSAMISDTVRLAVDGGKALASGGAGAPAVASDAVNAIAGAMKQDTVRSGNLGGASGFLAKNVPYLIIKRPRQSLAKTYIDELGYPCNASYTLGSLSGYTRCEKVEFKSATATSEEHSEIERILCGEGVLL